MHDVIVLIPAYKRFIETKKIVKLYSELGVKKIFLAIQDYTFLETMELVDICPRKVRYFKTEPGNIGEIRKKLFKFAVNHSFYSDIKYIIMQDNDIIYSEKDIKLLLEIARLNKYKNINVFSPDTRNICSEDELIKIDNRAFSFVILKYDKVNQIFKKLSPIPANEDAELIYLLGNKAVLINNKLLEKPHIDVTSETTIENKITKLKESAEYLYKKYPGKVEIITRPSGKTIAKFKQEEDKDE